MHTSDQPPRKFSPQERRFFLLLSIVGVVFILFFGMRTVRSYIRLQRTGLKPGVTDVEAIRGWMTIPYIAAAYHVPPDYLFEQIGVPAENNRNKSVAQLNRDLSKEQGVLITTVRNAITRYQQEHPGSPEVPHE